MTELLADLVWRSADKAPHATALIYGSEHLSYEELAGQMGHAARGLLAHGLERGERVAVCIEKRTETVVAMFATSAAGCVFVPVNPFLRPRQVGHILRDCSVRVLVTSVERRETLASELEHCPDLRMVVTVDGTGTPEPMDGQTHLGWDGLLGSGTMGKPDFHRVIDSDMTAILYTSGSTGMPKGVVLSHRNVVTGAKSVSSYLENTPQDRILALLPFSFDYGLSQLTTAFNVGARTVIMNYLLPGDVLKMAAAEGITGLGCVAPLWSQLAQLTWPRAAVESLRYITNTGGAMPGATVKKLRASLPKTKVYLMYGLTEAFRSTYLPPEEVDRRPDSIGKSIPNAEVLVVRENGELCGPGEPGELVHRGPLVSLGYWNDPERTAERFKPSPVQPPGICLAETAVWSGDTVRMDGEGFLYFVGRRDEMIKTSGYRVSPTEVEEVVYASGHVGEAVALGVPHATLGQAILVVATPPDGAAVDAPAVIDACKRELPAYMVPHGVVVRDSLPRNPNGKVDRKLLAAEHGTDAKENDPG